MGRKKKVAVEKPVAEPAIESVQEGDIDPYAAGNHIENPEPNNGAANRPVEDGEDGQPSSAPAVDVPDADEAEQDEVAAGRVE